MAKAKARKEYKDDSSLIRDRRDASAKWLNENYWSDFTEVYRASKCLTKPIMKKDGKGNLVEDKTRTNVAMPDISRVIRQNTARMTVNPPLLNYLCPDEGVAVKLTSWRYQQFDRSNESAVRRLHVQQEETFGFSVTKSFWDKISHDRKRRVPPEQWNRSMVTEAQLRMNGVPDDQVQGQVQQAIDMLGPDLGDAEMSSAMAQFGSELMVQDEYVKYEGPRCKWVFIGDFYPEPGFRNLHDGWMVEEYIENDAFLEEMNELTYCDEDGNEQQCFSDKAIADLEADDSFDYSDLSRYQKGLRAQLRSAIGQSDMAINVDRRQLQKGKRYRIFENHEEIDGKWYKTYIGNGKILLGRMPYEFDLGGRSVYTPFVGLPDLLVGIGDSTPRMMRFLYNLHNATVGARQDLVNNLLRRTVLRKKNSDIPDEVVERANLRILDVKELTDFSFPNEPDVPASAFETEASIMRQMASLEPSLFSTDSGDASNPGAGKLATTAVLSQKSQDALLQWKLDQLALYDKELAEKDLLMLQAELQAPGVSIQNRFRKAASQGLGRSSDTGEGERVDQMMLSPYEIQLDIDVEPSVGSTLAQDDEFHRMAWERLYQLAAANPAVWNMTEVAKGYAKCIRGADASKLINPPAPPQPPPPKVAISVAFKGESLTSGVQAKILQEVGLPLDPNDISEMQHNDLLEGIKKVGDAADAAGKLAEPPDGLLKAHTETASALNKHNATVSSAISSHNSTVMQGKNAARSAKSASAGGSKK